MTASITAMPSSSPLPSLTMSPSSSSSTRRSNISHSRKRTSDSSLIPSSPSKRSRVTFDSDVEVREMNETAKAPELIQEEVRSAFIYRARGDRESYDTIKAVFTPQADQENEYSPLALRRYATALLQNVPSLNKTNRDLVEVLINSEWLGRDEDYVALFTRLLASVATSNAGFLEDILSMLVDNLRSTPPSNGNLDGEPAVAKTKLYARVHNTIRYLTQIIPATSSTLLRVLSGAVPHLTDTVRAHSVYAKNLLRVIEYAPELRFDLLGVLTDNIVKLDVHIQIDIEELEQDVAEDLVLELPLVSNNLLEDLPDDSETSDDESDFEDDEEAETTRKRDIKRNVDKMDSLLDILFTYYDQNYSGLKNGMAASTVIDYLLCHFDALILPAFRSRHTQFLLFHFVQRSPADVDQFVGACASKVLDKKQSNLTRQNAAAYLGSFVARGMKVPAEMVRLVFQYISGELDRMREECEPCCRGPDLEAFPVYYCLVQTLMYVFCFRWQDLEVNPGTEDDEEDDLDFPFTAGHQWRVDVKGVFQANIFSALNPLKVCSPAIVEQFAKIAKHLGVVFVYHLLETNKRLRLPTRRLNTLSNRGGGYFNRETALSLSNAENRFHLDAYFPFDPYHLPRSKRWIQDDYRAWQHIKGLDDEGSDSDESEEDFESDVEDGTATDLTAVSQ